MLRRRQRYDPHRTVGSEAMYFRSYRPGSSFDALECDDTCRTNFGRAAYLRKAGF